MMDFSPIQHPPEVALPYYGADVKRNLFRLGDRVFEAVPFPGKTSLMEIRPRADWVPVEGDGSKFRLPAIEWKDPDAATGQLVKALRDYDLGYRKGYVRVHTVEDRPGNGLTTGFWLEDVADGHVWLICGTETVDEDEAETRFLFNVLLPVSKEKRPDDETPQVRLMMDSLGAELSNLAAENKQFNHYLSGVNQGFAPGQIANLQSGRHPSGKTTMFGMPYGSGLGYSMGASARPAGTTVFTCDDGRSIEVVGGANGKEYAIVEADGTTRAHYSDLHSAVAALMVLHGQPQMALVQGRMDPQPPIYGLKGLSYMVDDLLPAKMGGETDRPVCSRCQGHKSMRVPGGRGKMKCPRCGGRGFEPEQRKGFRR